MFEIMLRRVTAQPPSFERSRMLASIYFTQEDYEKALEVLDSIKAEGLIDQDPATYYAFLKQILTKLGRTDEAMASLREGIDAHPQVAGDLAYELAMVLEISGDTPASRQVMRETLEKYPNHAGLNNALGYAWANEGINLPEARKLIETALRESPEEPAYLDSMGWVLYKLGDFEQALNYLRQSRALQQIPHPVILDHLGDTLYRLGRQGEAVASWKEAADALENHREMFTDPELEGLDDRLAAKMQAVADGQPAPVAAVAEAIAPAIEEN
jgi:tetratricopeptide (TPR) repeat protein